MISPEVSCFNASTQWQPIIFQSASKDTNSKVSKLSNWATSVSIAECHCSAFGPLRASLTLGLLVFSNACMAHGVICFSVWVDPQSDLIWTSGELVAQDWHAFEFVRIEVDQGQHCQGVEWDQWNE